MPITDLSARPIPRDSAGLGSNLPPTLALQPTYQAPDTKSTEFLYSAYIVAAVASGYTNMLDAVSNAAFAATVDANQAGKLANIFLYCPDMVAASAPYLFARLLVNQQPANAWGTVPFAPRTGIASISFDANMLLQPNVTLTMQIRNDDPGATHFVFTYLYGWTYPK